MKLNKKFLIVFLAIFYLIVIQKIVTLYLFANADVNTPVIQLQQEILPYTLIIKIALLLIGLSVMLVFLILKKKMETEFSTIPKDMFIILILIVSAVIPIVALLNAFLTGDILLSSILISYGVLFTTAIIIH